MLYGRLFVSAPRRQRGQHRDDRDLDVDAILSALPSGRSRGRRSDRWRDDLALWAVRRRDADSSRAVVTLTAPKLFLPPVQSLLAQAWTLRRRTETAIKEIADMLS